MCVFVTRIEREKKKRNDKGNDNQNGIFCMHAWYGIEMPNFFQIKKRYAGNFFFGQGFSLSIALSLLYYFNFGPGFFPETIIIRKKTTSKKLVIKS